MGYTDIRTPARYAKALMEGQQKVVRGFEVSGGIKEIVDLNTKKSITG